MINVTLRKKPISKGRLSLYLDFFPPAPNARTGKLTRREFLKIHILEKPKDALDRQHNKEMRLLAKQICNKREQMLNKPEIYTDYEREMLRKRELGERSFIKYMEQLAEKRNGTSYDVWICAIRYVKAFFNDDCRFKDLNEGKLNDYKDFLLRTYSLTNSSRKLANNTALSYFNKLKAALKSAFKEGLLEHDLNGRVSPIPEQESRREYLTMEELNKLYAL